MLKADLKKYVSFNALLLVSMLGLNACGGGSGGFKPKIQDGVFKDSNVSGLSYVSGKESGITGENGEFRYEEGNTASFSIGGVDLGKGEAKAVMTPLDLVKNGKLGSDEVINKARFLMMLDKDNDPNNGITISEKVRKKAKDWKKIDFASDNFPTAEVYSMLTEASVEDDTVHLLPTKDKAVAHLKTTLVCSSSGVFSGDFSGSDKGKMVLVVDPVSGEVVGSTLKEGSVIPSEVSNVSKVDYDNEFQFVSIDSLKHQFTGKMANTDKMVGSWANTEKAEQKGVFSAARIGGSNDALYRYSLLFQSSDGKDAGVYSFDINKSNRISGVAYDLLSGKQQDLKGKLADDGTLTVELDDKTKITGFISDSMEVLGTWINSKKQQTGSFKGAGCRLN